MPLQPTLSKAGNIIQERIMCFGGPDSGKSTNILTIADWHQKLGSDAQFYVIATDHSYGKMLGPQGRFGHLENVHYEYVLEMQEYLDEGRRVRKLAKKHDWLVSDLQHDAWGAASDEYAQRAFGTSLSDRWANDGDPGKYPISGWDWGMPNARYREFANNYIVHFPGHVYAASGEKGLVKESRSGNSGGEEQEMLNIFGNLGVKPMGQKLDPFRFDTIIHLNRNSRGKWTMATARDKERQRVGQQLSNGTMRGVEYSDFFTDYLLDVAGWSIVE